MATQLERERLRMDMGLQKDDIVSLPDEVIDDIFLQAGENFEDETVIAINARIITIRRLLMQAANEVDYTQNNTSEKASQRYKHLAGELERWTDMLDIALAVSGQASAVRSGKPTRTPPRIAEYPWGNFAKPF